MSEPDRIEVAALIARVSLGLMFVAHGLLKVLVFTLPGTVQFFASVGLPGALAYPTVAAEVIGGVLLIAGIGPRVVALALIPILLGATWVHLGNGWLFSAPNGGWEYPAFLTVLAVIVALMPAHRYVLVSGRTRRPAALAGA